MILEYSKTLSRQSIYANGDELVQILARDKDRHGKRVRTISENKKIRVHDFDRPVLVTDAHQIAQLPSVKRDTLFALFASDHKTTRYQNVELRFEQTLFPGVWGPSIDTMLFCRAIIPSQLNHVHTAAEIGSGSGYLSKFLLHHLPKLQSITLVDIDSQAIACCKKNIPDKRAKFIQGDGKDVLRSKRFDLVVCNPPYIPRPKSIDDNPYEGISLLHFLIHHARHFLTPQGMVLTNLSSLCESIVMPWIKQSGLSLTVLDEMEVPLKVYNVLNNSAWMNYLLKRGLKKTHKRGYDYWQRLKIIQISISTNKGRSSATLLR